MSRGKNSVRNWILLTNHDNEANATRQSGGKMIYSKIFINKNPSGGNKSRKLKLYVATTDTLCFQHHVSSHSPRKVTFTRCNPMLTVNWSIIFSNHCSSCLQAQFPNLLQHRLRILQAQMSAKLRIMDISQTSGQSTHLTPIYALTIQGRKKKVAAEFFF